LDKASNSIRKNDRAVVVEGYFDVIALHAAGIHNTVAALGTALSSKQITQLCRCSDSKQIVLNFDADSAGIRAANRAIGEVERLAMQGQLDLRILHLPSGKDPDEFLKTHGPGEYRALLDQCPLWLDWQIEQVLNGLDLAKADHFQLAVSGLVQLLGKLPQSAVRTHYLQKAAERLSGGQARFALQLEEDLRKQVKGQRWHGRSNRYEQPGEGSQRERSEAEILRLYLHCSRYRSAIRLELRQRELEDFALQHHRLLWAAITDLEETNLGAGRIEAINRGNDSGDDLADIDLPRLLSDQLMVENTTLLTRLTPLLEPGEVQLAALAEPMLQLRGTAAALERQKSLKRCRHLLEAWSGQRLETLEKCISALIEEERQQPDESFDMEKRIDQMFQDLNSDALHFQDLYYSERKHILHLDQQRCAGFGNKEPVSA
jgi:DNA primase